VLFLRSLINPSADNSTGETTYVILWYFGKNFHKLLIANKMADIIIELN
jgi:hypothetical protein